MSEEAAAPVAAEGVSAPETPVVEAPVVESAPEPSAPKTEPKLGKREIPDVGDTLRKSFEKVRTGETSKPVADGDRPRNPDGTFAQKEAQPDAQPPVQPQVAPEAPKPADPQDAPPAWLHEGAKADWSKAPPSVRAEFGRRTAELENGLNEYRQRWEPLKQYDEIARRNGTTLHQSYAQMVDVEQRLSRDIVGGLEHVARIFGHDLRKIAEHVVAQPAKTPEQINYEQQLEAQQRQLQQLEQQNRAVTEGMIARFAETHPRFEELAEGISFALQTGKAADLEAAYEYAARLIPAPTPAPQTGTPPAAQTRDIPAPQTSKSELSLNGAPGSNPRPAPAKSVDEAIRRGAERLGLRI